MIPIDRRGRSGIFESAESVKKPQWTCVSRNGGDEIESRNIEPGPGHFHRPDSSPVLRRLVDRERGGHNLSGPRVVPRRCRWGTHARGVRRLHFGHHDRRSDLRCGVLVPEQRHPRVSQHQGARRQRGVQRPQHTRGRLGSRRREPVSSNHRDGLHPVDHRLLVLPDRLSAGGHARLGEIRVPR